MRFSLLALLPPGSVEADVGKLQQGVFSRFGLVSAIALPPLVPVSFLADAEVPLGFLKDVNAMAAAPVRFEIGGLIRRERALYLEVRSAGLWPALRQGALARVAEGPALFPVGEGFFLGCVEAGLQTRDLGGIEAPVSSFSSSRLAFMTIETKESGDGWWRNVSWEIARETPLRGRRR